MAKYELIKGDENGVVDPTKNLLSVEDGCTIREVRTGKTVAVAVDINSPRKSPRPPAISIPPPVPATAKGKKPERLVSLDVFRGFTVAVRFLDPFFLLII